MAFHPTGAPQALADAFERHVKAGDHHLAADLLDEHLQEGGERRRAILVALAWTRFESALRVHVDDVEELAAAAEALLDEARPLDAAEEKLRRKIRGARSREKRKRSAVAALAAIPDSDLSVADAKELAYQLSSSRRPEDQARAARLFLRCEKEAPADAPQFFLAHAAGCFAEAGLFAEAEPLLRILTDTPHPRLVSAYPWQIVGAWEILLDHAFQGGDRAAILSVWQNAAGCAGHINPTWAFPIAHERQDRLLATASRLGLDEIARAIAAAIRKERKRLAPDIQALVRRYT
jgi:hypothetical protein